MDADRAPFEDQTSSNRDQTAPDRDQKSSDHDQTASDRDQSASDQDQESSNEDQDAPTPTLRAAPIAPPTNARRRRVRMRPATAQRSPTAGTAWAGKEPTPRFALSLGG
jgi:hypothetical protein